MKPPAIDRRELAGLGALLLLAAIVRFVGLPGRGTWDADQGHDMLTLLRLVRDGTIPLLGPPTSIGDFHHGALYYYLLAPAAFVSDANPTAVVAEIALAGTAAVAVTWWLARSMAGPIAAFVAAVMMAISASAIDESTFIWNPNLIALSSAVALAGAWRARTTGRARWWLVAAVGLVVTMQCHVLGIALLPPIVGLWAVAWRATPRGPERSRLERVGIASLGIVLLGYVPLAVHEIGHDFSESRAALAFIASGGTGISLSLPARLLFVGLRILAWPLTGLLTDGLAIGVVAGVLVAAGLAWRAGQGPGRERTAARFLGATLVFGWIVLTFGAAGLSSVTPLPVDHYHAFLDPVVFVSVGMIAAALWTIGTPAARASLVVGLVVLIAWNVAIWPPAVATDGGWPAAETAGGRIERAAGERAIQFIGLPAFKSSEAYGFPLAHDGRAVSDHLPASTANPPAPAPDPTAAVAVLCDSLFIPDCGGPAEQAATASWPAALRLVDRWKPAPGRTLSVYLPATAAAGRP